jgi:hypothetical protein
MNLPPPTPLDPPPRERFQFSLAAVILATLLCAIAAAATRAMGLPIAVQAALVAVLIIEVLYFTLRAPFVLRNLLGRGRRWDEIRKQKADMQRIIDERRAAREQKT